MPSSRTRFITARVHGVPDVTGTALVQTGQPRVRPHRAATSVLIQMLQLPPDVWNQDCSLLSE